MRILAILMILTLSSCLVSQKTFDEKCCALEAEIQELKSQAAGMELKEQLLRQAIHDLKVEPGTVVPHDPLNK